MANGNYDPNGNDAHPEDKSHNPMDPKHLYGENTTPGDYVPQGGPTRRPLDPSAEDPSELEKTTEDWEVLEESLEIIKRYPR